MKITATIITFNEAANIRAACESVAWADEILVVDSESTDSTREIAAECGARVLVNTWPGFSAQKQLAVESASHDWIFSLDADERVSSELQNSIAALRNRDESTLSDGYRVARQAFYMGRWIRGGGWYPDYQLRLFKRTQGHWGERLIHESVSMNICPAPCFAEAFNSLRSSKFTSTQRSKKMKTNWLDKMAVRRFWGRAGECGAISHRGFSPVISK